MAISNKTLRFANDSLLRTLRGSFAIIAISSIASLTACGDDSSSSGTTPENTSSIDEVADVSLLPPCTASNEYKIIRVLNEETPRICRDNKWFAIAEESDVQSSDSKGDNISSSTVQPDKGQDGKSSSSISNNVAKANSSDSQKNESSSSDNIEWSSGTDNSDIIDIVEPRDSIVLDSEKVAVSLDEVSGVTQKGPFLSGSRVLVREMTDGRTLTQTGNSFNGKILNDNGEFKIKARMLVSQYVMLEASGYYRNEITGENSNSELTLFAITNVSSRNVVNMNLLTHLEYERVIYLVTQKKMKVNAAKKQAQQEVLNLLHIDAKNFSNSEDLNIAGASDEDAALLAFSIILQGDRSVSQLSELLTKIAIDMEEDGSWDNAAKRAEFADWALEAEQSGRIKTIRNNVASWKLSSVVPDFEKHIHHFWTTEYGLGVCSEDKQGVILQDTNSLSTSKDKYFICIDGHWRSAAPIEYDTYEWEVGDDGDSRYGDVVTTNCYVYEDGSWRSGNSTDCSLGLRGCTALRQDTVDKGSDNVWHICDAKSWRNATTYEKDTFGWKDSTDGAIKKGYVTDSMYVFDKTLWRTTSNVEGKLGGCVTAIADSVGVVESIYYVCRAGKWTDASALEYDTYRWAAGKDGDVKLGSVNTKNCYVYEDNSWRSGNSSDCTLGLRGCTALRQDTVGKGSDNVWHICDAKSWRNATTYEKDTFGWKDSTDGAIRKGNVTDTVYVFDKTLWRATSAVEGKLGGCVTAIADSVGKVGSTYYICKSGKWVDASALEYDTYKWTAGKDGDSKLGSINTKNCYVYEDNSWRSGNSNDCSLGLRGCTVLRQDTVGMGSDKVWHICDSKSWRNATSYEKDTFGWKDSTDGAIKKGNVTDTVYVFDKTSWRATSAVEGKLGGCVSAIADSVGKVGSTYYICKSGKWTTATALEYDTYRWTADFDGEVRIGQVNINNYYIYDESKKMWRIASDLEKDTYDYENNQDWAPGEDGDYKNGSVTTYMCYVFDGDEWRIGNYFDCNLGIRGCTKLRQGVVELGTYPGYDPLWYICDEKKWRGATDIEKDTATWGSGDFDGEVRIGKINKDLYYTYENQTGVWRKATDIEADAYDHVCSEFGQIVYGHINPDSVYFCYGKQWKRFHGNENTIYGKLVDSRDGQIYRTVKIGGQTWMAENLNYADSINYPSMLQRNWCYNQSYLCENYGRLYSWSAVIDSVYWTKKGKKCGDYQMACNLPEKVQGICPDGWHLPNYSEWMALFDAIGSVKEATQKLKSRNGWHDYENQSGNGSDEYGFSVLPTGEMFKYSGTRYVGVSYYDLGASSSFWLTSEIDTDLNEEIAHRVNTVSFSYHYDDRFPTIGGSGNHSKNSGFSVRCVKDE